MGRGYDHENTLYICGVFLSRFTISNRGKESTLLTTCHSNSLNVLSSFTTSDLEFSLDRPE